jgi:hypothetical protein
MTIDYANSKVTMDFTYNNDNFTYFVRFHNTETHGLTISVSSDGVEYLDLPADMFVEISDFLIEKGVIPGREIKKEIVVAHEIPEPRGRQHAHSSKLPIPNVVEDIKNEAGGNPASQIEVIQPLETDEEGFQSFDSDIGDEDEGLVEEDVEETVQEEDTDVEETVVERPVVEKTKKPGKPVTRV